MTTDRYDAIVVGARCAGSPTAMLLARRGYRVLLVDKATFPSDTVSSHLIHPPGVAALQRWGLRDAVAATGCPPIGTYVVDFGPFTLAGSPGTADSPVAYAPRRTVLDELLVGAAADAGVEVRQGFTVSELVVDDDRVIGIRGHGRTGPTVTETAPIVVGADGRNSLVARTVQPEEYHEQAPLLHAYYSYWSDVPGEGHFETYVRPGRGLAAWPTNDGLLLVIAGWPASEAAEHKPHVEASVQAVLDLAPGFAERVRAGTRRERFVGTAVRNFFRRPYGRGWVLVGDAGYNKDFITAQGIQDAFLDAERCSAAIDEALSGARSFRSAMADYQAARDARVLPIYELTTELATLEPPPPHLQQLLAAAHGNQEATDGFTRVMAGVTSPADYFSDDNVGRILAAAGQVVPA